MIAPPSARAWWMISRFFRPHDQIMAHRPQAEIIRELRTGVPAAGRAGQYLDHDDRIGNPHGVAVQIGATSHEDIGLIDGCFIDDDGKDHR